MKSGERRAKGASIRFEPEPEPFSVEVLPDRHRVRVVPHGEVDIATVSQVAANIDELVGRGFDAVVLDLRATVFMDSSGLHLLLEYAHERVGTGEVGTRSDRSPPELLLVQRDHRVGDGRERRRRMFLDGGQRSTAFPPPQGECELRLRKQNPGSRT